ACMTGCRYGAKNTLDKNYLYFAEKKGATIQADSQVLAIRPRSEGGYELTVRRRKGWLRFAKETVHAQQVVISAGVLGSVELLLKMRQDPKALPHLSPRLGQFVRTNNESIIGVVTSKPQYNFSEGIAISSIIHTDEHSHIEPVRYGQGSGFFRLLLAPHAPGANFWMRSKSWMSSCAAEPWRWLQAIFVSDFSKSTQILLYMRSLDGTLTFTLKKRPYLAFRQTLGSILGVEAKQPQAFMKEATDLAKQFAKRVDGVLANVFTESLLGIASTAHILGGCCMGQNPEEGVIDHQHQVFGYKGLYVIDGSAVSANPGVNPSLTITALAERAMSFIKPAAHDTKSAAQDKV
ncbi:MAG: GMC oxidoreductase, partial [Proteobacteria bacterium]|nr:GMC oxidoreductase [Pseudomonadota bacterium]